MGEQQRSRAASTVNAAQCDATSSPQPATSSESLRTTARESSTACRFALVSSPLQIRDAMLFRTFFPCRQLLSSRPPFERRMV